MAKLTYKVQCEAVNQQSNRGTVLFAIGAETVKTEPGKPPARVAKTVFNLSFPDPAVVKIFMPGKDYTVTIEG